MNQVTISNASPLIAFLKKAELSVLRELFGDIIIPDAVQEEIMEGSDQHPREISQFQEGIEQGWIRLKNPGNSPLKNHDLGEGEAEAIALCLEEREPLLLMDEKEGRNIAKSLNIKVLGTLGILALSHKKGLKKEKQAGENLRDLIKNGFYLSSEVILRFLRHLEV